MATVTLTLYDPCDGGDHFTLTLTGDVTGARRYDVAEIQDIVQNVQREELAAAIIRIAKIGRTNAQLKALLQAGITVTI